MFEKNIMLFLLLLCSFASIKSICAEKPTLELLKNGCLLKNYNIISSISKSEFGTIFLAQCEEKFFCLKCMFEQNFFENEFEVFKQRNVRKCKNITQCVDKFLIVTDDKRKVVVLVTEYNCGNTIFEIWTD